MIRHLVNTVTLSGALTFASFVLVFTTLMCGGVMLAAWYDEPQSRTFTLILLGATVLVCLASYGVG